MDTSSRALPRWRWLCFAALSLGGMALLALAAAEGRFTPPLNWLSGEVRQMWRMFGVALALALATALVRPVVAHRWLTVALGVWMILVFGPGASVAVAFLAIAASAIGARLLRAAAATQFDLFEAISAGAVAIVAVVGATAALKWHWPAVYALILSAATFACRRDARTLGAAVAAWWSPRRVAPSRGALMSLALLAATLAVHVVVAAKPEVGHDALAMHLEVATEMSRDHRFAFDVKTRAWAVMPLGADWLYAIAYQLAGESAAKLANLGAFLLVLGLIAKLAAVDGGARALPAALAALFASMPVAFAETGTLFIENYWTALLLASAAAAERALRKRSVGWAIACLWFSAGAMQAKVPALFWIAPLLVMVAWSLRDRVGTLTAREFVAIAVAGTVLVWPYVNAWFRTGNPVFPFLNGIFRSPLGDVGETFMNPLYTAPLTWRTWYDLVVDSGHYLEGSGGALGIHWLILFPAVFLLLPRSRVSSTVPWLALALAFSIAVFVQQSYLRYLYPAFALLLAIAGRIAATMPSATPSSGLLSHGSMPTRLRPLLVGSSKNLPVPPATSGLCGGFRGMTPQRGVRCARSRPRSIWPTSRARGRPTISCCR